MKFSLKKKALMMITTAAVVMTVTVMSSTGAWFNSFQANQGSASAATLKLGGDNKVKLVTGENLLPTLTKEEHFAAGATKYKNEGSVPVKVQTKITFGAKTAAGGDLALANYPEAKYELIVTAAGKAPVTYEGSVTAPVSMAVIELQPGETIDVQARLWLTGDANNTYQGLTFAGQLNAYATQTNKGAY